MSFPAKSKRSKISVEEINILYKDNLATDLKSFLIGSKWTIFKDDDFFVKTRYSNLMLFISGCFHDLSTLIYNGKGVIDVFKDICLNDEAFKKKLLGVGVDVKAIYSDSLFLLVKDVEKKIRTFGGNIPKERSKETSLMREFINAHLSFLECQEVIDTANENYMKEMEECIQPLRNVLPYIGEFNNETLLIQRICFHAALNFELSNPRPQTEDAKKYLFLNLKKEHLFFILYEGKELQNINSAIMKQCLNWIRGCLLDGNQNEAGALMNVKAATLKWVAENFAEAETKTLKRKLLSVFHPDKWKKKIYHAWSPIIEYLYHRCHRYDYLRHERDGRRLEKELNKFRVPVAELEEWKTEQKNYINKTLEKYKKGEKDTVNLYSESLIIFNDDMNDEREDSPIVINSDDSSCLKSDSLSVKPAAQQKEKPMVKPKCEKTQLPSQSISPDGPVKLDTSKEGTTADSLFVEHVVQQKEKQMAKSKRKRKESPSQIIPSKGSEVEFDISEQRTTLVNVGEAKK